MPPNPEARYDVVTDLHLWIIGLGIATVRVGFRFPCLRGS